VSSAEIAPGLQAAIEAAGGSRYRLARALGISTQAVLKWRDVPVHRILELEQKLGIPRERLRPELFAVA
jgi:hypothetical protein